MRIDSLQINTILYSVFNDRTEVSMTDFRAKSSCPSSGPEGPNASAHWAMSFDFLRTSHQERWSEEYIGGVICSQATGLESAVLIPTLLDDGLDWLREKKLTTSKTNNTAIPAHPLPAARSGTASVRPITIPPISSPSIIPVASCVFFM